jgi:hypothetical protein
LTRIDSHRHHHNANVRSSQGGHRCRYIRLWWVHQTNETDHRQMLVQLRIDKVCKVLRVECHPLGYAVAADSPTSEKQDSLTLGGPCFLSAYETSYDFIGNGNRRSTFLGEGMGASSQQDIRSALQRCLAAALARTIGGTACTQLPTLHSSNKSSQSKSSDSSSGEGREVDGMPLESCSILSTAKIWC